jgi:hypothetical protein
MARRLTAGFEERLAATRLATAPLPTTQTLRGVVAEGVRGGEDGVEEADEGRGEETEMGEEDGTEKPAGAAAAAEAGHDADGVAAWNPLPSAVLTAAGAEASRAASALVSDGKCACASLRSS